MTWTLAHTIADTSTTASQGAADAAAYLLDTVMPAKGFTVSAHPDASAFKRVMSYTLNNDITGSTYTLRWWASYGSTTSSNQFTVYDDPTYTTTPGDLANNSSFGSNWTVSSSYVGAGKSWKFWNSDQNANAILVTRGPKVWFYWPGISSACIYVDDSWTGAAVNASTTYLPMTNSYPLNGRRAPVYTTSASTLYLHPAIGSPNVGQLTYDGLFQGYELLISNSSGTIDSYASRAFSITAADVLLWLPAIPTTTRTVFAQANERPMTLKMGTNYYLSSYKDRSSCSLMFDFGTSEPDFS